MSRPVRIEFPGAVYHVTSKGREVDSAKINSSKINSSKINSSKINSSRISSSKNGSALIARDEQQIDQDLDSQKQSAPNIPASTDANLSSAVSNPTVFRDAEDKGVFLNVVDNVVDRFGWLIHSYVLLPDHYQLVVEVPDANLSKGMRQLNGVYTQHVNRRHETEGPIFSGRFKSVLFEKKPYLLPICRHVVTHPVRHTPPENYAAYRWSSYRALSGQVKVPGFLHADEVLQCFGKREKGAQRKYRDYVKAGLNEASPLERRTNQVLLGSPKFLNQMQPILQGERLSKRGPKAARRRRSLTTIFRRVADKSRQERNELIREAHLEFGYTLMEIGEHLGLHYTTVSKVVNA